MFYANETEFHIFAPYPDIREPCRPEAPLQHVFLKGTTKIGQEIGQINAVCASDGTKTIQDAK